MKQYKAKSGITGAVWKIEKKLGDVIVEGNVLMIIESMKMEIPVIAEESGTIIEVCVAEGSSVAEGMVVMIIEQ